MGVELPQLLRVLAHEIRGPLSVIQGYLRLMSKQRDEASTDMPMLKAMLDASGRLTSMAKHASDISVLLREPPPALRQVPIGQLLSAVAARPAPRVHVELTNGDRETTVAAQDEALLAFALGSLVEAVARNAGADAVAIAKGSAQNGCVGLTIRPLGEDGASGPEHFSAFAFDQGGFGLALVLASFVLDGHKAHATVGSRGALDISLPHGGAD